MSVASRDPPSCSQNHWCSGTRRAVTRRLVQLHPDSDLRSPPADLEFFFKIIYKDNILGATVEDVTGFAVSMIPPAPSPMT
jgi:hypothetical protein